jgi:hypothetical protein
MNKSVIESLVKIANSLDNLGYIREANRLDKIAQTMAPPVSDVTQQNAYNMVGSNNPTPTNTPATTNAPVTNGQNATNDKYVKDINTYKNLLQQGKMKEAEYFLEQVVNSYQDQQQRNAFSGQAAKILNQINYQLRNQDSMSDDEIYNLLQKYGINDAADLADLNKKWNVMMTNLKNQKLLPENKIIFLRNTYLNVAAKFNYSAFGLEVTGNYKKDLYQYKKLNMSRLTNDAETFLSNVMSSDKYNDNQKQLFAKDAEIKKAEYNPEFFNKDGYIDTLSDKFLNRQLSFYGVLNAKNYQEFNNAFYNMIKNYFMKVKFPEDINNPKAPMIYGYPGVRKKLQLVKEKIMLQRGWNKPV